MRKYLLLTRKLFKSGLGGFGGGGKKKKFRAGNTLLLLFLFICLLPLLGVLFRFGN